MIETVKKALINESPLNAGAVIDHLLPTIAISLSENRTKNKSKIGGIPDVPNNFKYPELNGKPYVFISQIFINEIKHFDLENKLPDKGILYFFIQDYLETYPTQKDYVKVIYIEEHFETASCNFNNGVFPTIKEYFIDFKEYLTIPSTEDSYHIKNQDYLNLFEENDFIFNIQEKINEIANYSADIGSQILGHTKNLQNDPAFSWVHMNQKFDQNFDYVKAEKEAKEQAPRYISLLQLDFLDGDYDERFNNVFYFGIHEEDLRIKNFSNVRFTSQND